MHVRHTGRPERHRVGPSMGPLPVQGRGRLRPGSRLAFCAKWPRRPVALSSEHLASFNAHSPDRLQVVLHTGAKVGPDARQIEIDDPEAY